MAFEHNDSETSGNETKTDNKIGAILVPILLFSPIVVILLIFACISCTEMLSRKLDRIIDRRATTSARLTLPTFKRRQYSNALPRYTNNAYIIQHVGYYDVNGNFMSIDNSNKTGDNTNLNNLNEENIPAAYTNIPGKNDAIELNDMLIRGGDSAGAV